MGSKSRELEEEERCRKHCGRGALKERGRERRHSVLSQPTAEVKRRVCDADRAAPMKLFEFFFFRTVPYGMQILEERMRGLEVVPSELYYRLRGLSREGTSWSLRSEDR